MAILLDLDQKITSPENFSLLFYFMKDLVSDCMSRGIGYKTYIYSMFNSVSFMYLVRCFCTNLCSRVRVFSSFFFSQKLHFQANQKDCCSEISCDQTIDYLDYDTYVGNYDNDEPIQNETSNFNFTYTLISEVIKSILFNFCIILSV